MTARRRVVITGVGAVTPIGTAADGLWDGLMARRSAVRTLSRFDPAPFRSKIAAEIPDFRPQDFLDAKRARRLDRFSQLAVTPARLALGDACLEPSREDPDRVGAMMGTALGGVAIGTAVYSIVMVVMRLPELSALLRGLRRRLGATR